jgi:hypothetical protein
LPGNCYSINNNYQAAENHSLRIFPNPAHDYIHVVANLHNEKHCIAEITDKTGRIVATEKIAADNEGVFYWHTNLSQLSPGIYFVKFIFSSTTTAGKFVKK